MYNEQFTMYHARLFYHYAALRLTLYPLRLNAS
jgi:hypothetical protein